jgi:hypothetical protein
MKPINEALQEDAARRERWSYLTEGIEKDTPGVKSERMVDYRTRLVESMCENTQKWMNEQRMVTPSQQLSEDTLIANVGAFTTFAFPLVRRVMARLIAPELFTVQPMSQPTGKIFYLDFKYGTTDGGAGVTEGERIDLPTTNTDRTYADRTNETGDVNEMNMDISEVTVTAVQKALKAEWTIEAAQDLMAYHSLEAESELLAVMADQIIREIDRNLISDCLDGATAGTVTWDAGGYAGTLPSEQRAHNETLYEAIVEANNYIYKKRYVDATWIVADPDTVSRLEKIQGFAMNDFMGASGDIGHRGRHLFGTLKNRWLVYKDPWMTANTMLMGYRGSSWMDAGYVYAPYIPFYVSPTLIDPDTFKPRRGMMSRYAKQMVIGDMYSTVTITPAS